MALLLVRIERRETLPLNEFYDYNGTCYALSRKRENHDAKCIHMEDFYEATVDTRELSGIPVIFVSDTDTLLGWYRSARVCASVTHPSFFLEGNISCDASEAVLLPEKNTLADSLANFWMSSGSYEVVEREDARCESLVSMLESYQGRNEFLRYPYTHVVLDAKAVRDFDLCIAKCEELAAGIMDDACEDLRQIKELELYARNAASLRRKDPDGFYYHAMACYQLGFLRQGLKSIGKALELEPEASDLLAQKALLLASKGYRNEAAALFQQAFENSADESYLLWEGKTFLLDGQVDKGYACFKRIEDKALLEEAGIELKDLEKKWPFIGLRGFKLRDFFHS